MSITATDRSDARTIGTTFDKLDQKPPKAIADAYARYERITTGLGNMAPATGELAAAVVAAIDAGTDPAGDPTVQRLATAERIANPSIMQAAPSIALDQYRAIVTDQADAIVSAWAKTFDAAAARLADAFDVLGPVQLENTSAILTKGAQAADAWGAAQSATTTLDTIRGGWHALHRLTTGTVPNKRHALLIVADIAADEWTTLAAPERNPDPWTATTHGHRLTLSTIEGYRTRTAAIARADRLAQQRAQDERRPRGFGPNGGRPRATTPS